MKNSRITFIGCGNMGRSLIGGLIANGLPENSITGTDINAEQRQTTASQYNIEMLEDNQQAIKDVDVVVLAVKPQSMEDTLKPIKETLSQKKPLLISVAAGIKLSDLGTVTALSGSGPAYYFLIMEVMEKAALQLGLPQEQARILTLQTAFGAAKMALESSHDAESLRKQVTSPGGTTEQALKVLIDGGIEDLFRDALKAAQKRSAELADEFGNS